MIVDTSVLMAVIRREGEFERLRRDLVTSASVRVSAGTLIEARIVAERERGADDLLDLLDQIGAEVVPVDSRQVELAHEGFCRFGKGRHPARLNFGDLFAYALARAYDEPLLYVGTDFSQTDVRTA